ncbi:MAG: aldo/keto reductase [SAR202 cluster bacterium]|nr:aldo/keto reductase [SAR202 cluster bacterium]MDP6513697.1 aldo/keto reductase [SAR202 cluster bacterium]MDP6714357.1 aldo/keto reductase [SAR202 cluster bacterium]
MHYRTLGKTGLNVSLLSLGTGGPSMFGQNNGLEQKQQTELVRRCLDMGINLIDTHERYKDSEEILGKALKGVSRDAYNLVTKWAYAPGGDDFESDPEALSRSVERSLRRLGTDHVEVLLFHGLMPEHHDLVLERYVPVLQRLKDEGKVRFGGFSLRFVDDPSHEGALTALERTPELWDVIMLKFGILNQYASKHALPLAMEHNIGILNMAAVRFKLPDPKLLAETIADWKARGLIPSDALPDDDPLGWLVDDDVDSVISAAYKFAAEHPAIGSVISGTSSIEHMERNISAMERPYLPQEARFRLERLFGHIAEYA